MHKLTGYLGTYASPRSLGIYRFTVNLEDGSLSRPQLYYEAPDCKYLSMRGTCLASPVKLGTQAGICLLDTGSGVAELSGEAFHEASPACYVTQDGPDHNRLYTANYHEGSVQIYEKPAPGLAYDKASQGPGPDKTAQGPACDKASQGLALVKQLDIAPNAGCHQILFHEHYMLVPCLLLDTVKIFDCNSDFSLVGELKFDKGTGPRHGIFDKDHSRLFIVSELSNQIFVFRTDGRPPAMPCQDIRLTGHCPDISIKSVCSILPAGQRYSEAPASAAIRLSPDERFLYVSTRFADIITVFRIDGCRLHLIQQTGSGGIRPRDFVLTPDGSFLLAANRTEGGLVCFPIDPESGRLLNMCSRVPAPEAVSIVLGRADGGNEFSNTPQNMPLTQSVIE